MLRLLADIFLGYMAYKAYVRLNSLERMVESLHLENIISNFAKLKNNKWNKRDSSLDMDISKDGLILIHSGSKYANISARAATPLSKLHPMPHKEEYIVGYFEAKLLSYYNPMIGFCDNEYPLEKTKIGFCKNSVGLLYQGTMQIEGQNVHIDASKMCNSFKEGDVLGIGLICSEAGDDRKWKCFATRNGELLGTVDLPSHFHELQLFPAVSFGIKDTSIETNFGSEKWQFDPAQLVQ